MIDILVTYDPGKKEYNFYEPVSDTLLISKVIGTGFGLLGKFLKDTQGINILGTKDVRYHIDSDTFLGMVESNISLRRQLETGPSQFKTSEGRFGMSTGMVSGSGDFGRSKFGKGGEFSKSEKKWKK